MAVPERVKTQMKKHGLSGVNKWKRLTSGPKWGIVMASWKDGSGKQQYKLIRFGDRTMSTAGKPKAGESAAMKSKRARFKSRHQKNIKRGPQSAAYWANKARW